MLTLNIILNKDNKKLIKKIVIPNIILLKQITLAVERYSIDCTSHFDN